MIKSGDIVVFKNRKIDKSLNMFFTVSNVFTVKTKRNRVQEIVTLVGRANDGGIPLAVIRLATEEDRRYYDAIVQNISQITSTDESQHISSVSNEPKIQYVDEIDAVRAAFYMQRNKGGKWVYYKCNICDKYHIGKDLSQKNISQVVNT